MILGIDAIILTLDDAEKICDLLFPMDYQELEKKGKKEHIEVCVKLEQILRKQTALMNQIDHFDE
jgi:hypothetical protein